MKVATGTPWHEKDEQYSSLYRKVELEIEEFPGEGILINNPNPFSSLRAAKDHLFSVAGQYVPRRRYIYELYSDLINELDHALYQSQTAPQRENFLSCLVEKLHHLTENFQELQEILIAVATQKSNLDHEDEGYTRLYQETLNLIRDFDGIGISIDNPNPFRYLWHWYGFYKAEIGSYAECRQYVDALYRSRIDAIEKAIHRHQAKNTSQEALIEDLKHRLQNQNKSRTILKEPQPITLASQSSQAAPIKERWAFLVGINRYSSDFDSLKFCVKDVLALEKLLKELGYTVVCLHDQLPPDDSRYPTKVNVEAELTRLIQAVGSDDLLLVHFSCHGELSNHQPILVLRDSRLPTLQRSGLPLTELQQQMRQSKARRLILFLDACRTGVEMGRSIADPEFVRNAHELAEGFALLAASTSQQIAHEDPENQHGAFTYHLLQGLRGQADLSKKKFVTVDDLKNYTINGLRRWAVNYGKRPQEPTASTQGFGDMILADYRETNDEDN
ncbi:WD-40 repeat protein [Leptolyngbya sp. NIES-2104]|nr:WD-40 repeat protein [Leptolyngbya sp. NIES-2104]